MKKLFYYTFFVLPLVLQFACAGDSASQNQANFGREKVFPAPDKQYPNLEIYLNEYVGAQNRQDSEKIFSLTYPKLVELEGGRQSFTDEYAAVKNAKDYVYLAGKPAQTIKSEGQILAVIPVSTKRRVAGGWQFTREVIIAVSPDNGQRWTFADATDAEKRKILFPQAFEKFDIPEIRLPWIEK